jgi:DNA-binding MarR family transcriptional regulator
VLDVLREKTVKGAYRYFSMKDIADRLKLDRPGAVAEAVADLRKEYRERLRDESSISCEDEDVIANQNRGYHLRDWITVLDGLDEVETAAAKKQLTLTENQRGIIRLLRKHGKRTPRQLSDGLHLLRSIVTSEVEGLIAAGLVQSEGNAANKRFCLTST